ncbi:hypothetical protein B0F90DRAFT_1843713 [Multifurca ochricompacta]|uniref:WSC domain-containing protein n=1 Tax=Multifurca ochricompacta TaxID=376703 RepID=A0AAD4LXJ9_9AGAM|nr:hypothetical protein B0F90DRAFT_1843713 [Multifurca ochricompacta]
MKQLALFVVTTFALGTTAFNTPQIPLNWTTQFACAVDVPSRVLANVVTNQYTDNTPATCIQRCDAATFALQELNLATSATAGPGWSARQLLHRSRIAIWPALVILHYLAGGPCAFRQTDTEANDTDLQIPGPSAWRVDPTRLLLDTATSPAFGSPVVHQTFNTNLDLVNQCSNYCAHIGYPFSGVENASDCQCSFGLDPSAQIRSLSECSSTCPLPAGAGKRILWRVERLEVYKFSAN